MERPEIDWDDTDAFTAGTTGPQGRRVFFLQARRAGQVVSLKLEKQQVAGLAEFLHGLMGDLPPIDEPAVEVAETSARFEDPEEADWVVGSLGVTYQQSTDRWSLSPRNYCGTRTWSQPRPGSRCAASWWPPSSSGPGN
ncbi:MAG: hypothetical protein Ct9H300mP31_10930 [Acidimicrobiaceae bacterium]|nr:MAG: hypothetical protein Ct9H300mP31_10930 [Acidimicrobiaceae bacterium]